MLLSLVSLAAAHADPAPHVHGVSPVGLLVLLAWGALAVVWWRRTAV